MTFDYVRAYREAALPALHAIPFHILALVARVGEEARHTVQNDATLYLEWPEDGGALAAEFQRVCQADVRVFARAARAVYSAGHWDPDHNGLEGVHWRFASYADRTLRAYHPLKTSRTRFDHSVGTRIEIHEGVFRICLSSPSSWSWEEIAYADDEGRAFVTDVLKRLPPYKGRADQGDRWNRQWADKAQERLAKHAQRAEETLPDLVVFKQLIHAGDRFQKEQASA